LGQRLAQFALEAVCGIGHSATHLVGCISITQANDLFLRRFAHVRGPDIPPWRTSAWGDALSDGHLRGDLGGENMEWTVLALHRTNLS
jgi:hypothetical protein